MAFIGKSILYPSIELPSFSCQMLNDYTVYCFKVPMIFFDPFVSYFLLIPYCLFDFCIIKVNLHIRWYYFMALFFSIVLTSGIFLLNLNSRNNLLNNFLVFLLGW